MSFGRGFVDCIAVYLVWIFMTRLGNPEICGRITVSFAIASSIVAKTISNNISLNINFSLKKFVVDIKKDA
jgi:hypothetical protein